MSKPDGRDTEPAPDPDLLARLFDDRDRTARRVAALSGDVSDIVERSAEAARDDEHDPEGATIAFERAQATALRDAAREHLADIDAAIERVRLGAHRRCHDCGAPLPDERLQARPTAVRCVPCASAAGR